jgi:hypothetical protein
MSKGPVFPDECDVFTNHPEGPRRVGTFGWDSNSGRLWGTLSERIRTACEEAKVRSFVEVAGPVPSSIEMRIRDLFHSVKELEAIIASLGFGPRKEVARFYRQKFDDSFKKSDHKRFRSRGTEIVY